MHHLQVDISFVGLLSMSFCCAVFSFPRKFPFLGFSLWTINYSMMNCLISMILLLENCWLPISNFISFWFDRIQEMFSILLNFEKFVWCLWTWSILEKSLHVLLSRKRIFLMYGWNIWLISLRFICYICQFMQMFICFFVQMTSIFRKIEYRNQIFLMNCHSCVSSNQQYIFPFDEPGSSWYWYIYV